MSDDRAIEDFKEKMAIAAEFEKLKKENSEKRAIIDNKRVTSQLEKLKQDEKDLELAKNANYGALSSEQIVQIQKENDDYIVAAKSGMRFIDEVFDGVVPFFRKNFILVGAKTGDGKSTAAANIIQCITNQINPVTGKTRRALVLTNEERAEDVYNRVTALSMGWTYVNHNAFTDEQVDTFRRAISAFAAGGRITVIDNTHGGSHGVTTSLEGIESVFENLLENKEYYDVIIIDYYQNIIYSKKDPTMSENEVQARLTRMIDRYKNIYPAPIVMMAQMNPPDAEDRTPWQIRIKGRKIIADAATFVVEMAANRETRSTQWTVWKSRFTEAMGKTFSTGYSKGKFVKYDEAFIASVEKLKYEANAREIDKKIGLPDVFDKKKDENGPKS